MLFLHAQFRPFRLGRTWPTFNKLLLRIRGLFSIACGQSVVVLIVIYVFVVFGTKTFGHNFVGEFESRSAYGNRFYIFLPIYPHFHRHHRPHR